jgi:CRP/FNR family transcriptional regulator
MIRSQCDISDCDKCVAHETNVFSDLVPADLRVLSTSKSCRRCGQHYSKFAVPIADAQICHIPKEAFFSILSTNYQLASQMMGLLSTELKAAEERIMEMAQKPVRERLAETLLLLRQTYGVEADKTTLGIKLTRIELANIVGTATESVSRLLSKFKEEKPIDMNGRKLRIVDPAGLAKAANLDD